MTRGPMPALTIWQPWASFLALGLTPFETRPWPPPQQLIGERIALHAAARPVGGDTRTWASRAGAPALPLGQVIATAVLAAAYRLGPDTTGTGVHQVHARIGPSSARREVVKADQFGDFKPGRWAWYFTGPERLTPPVPVHGERGIWQWDPAGNSVNDLSVRRAHDYSRLFP
jgi:hypothetical protein